MDPEEIGQETAKVLLELARDALAASCNGRAIVELDSEFYAAWEPSVQLHPRLLKRGASFVTLTESDGSLRGCIGSLAAQIPLWRDVAQNARSAAIRDPRFAPVREDERESLKIEVSVLGEDYALEYETSEDLRAKLRPGVDGVVLSLRGRRATFLPQVWDRLPGVDAFMNQLCRKAGLFSSAWKQEHPEIRVYQVQKIGPA
ncbi:AmmeMemoRadiSam system protein A [Spirochaeta dissipatitropha]